MHNEAVISFQSGRDSFVSCSGLSIILPLCLPDTVMKTYISKIARGLFGCCPFLVGDYLFFDLQFIVTPNVCGDMCLLVDL